MRHIPPEQKKCRWGIDRQTQTSIHCTWHCRGVNEIPPFLPFFSATGAALPPDAFLTKSAIRSGLSRKVFGRSGLWFAAGCGLAKLEGCRDSPAGSSPGRQKHWRLGADCVNPPDTLRRFRTAANRTFIRTTGFGGGHLAIHTPSRRHPAAAGTAINSEFGVFCGVLTHPPPPKKQRQRRPPRGGALPAGRVGSFLVATSRQTGNQ